MLALADDSGLCVDALDGAPGVISARWSEDEAPGPASKADRDHANNPKLLRALAGRPDAERGAAYVAVLALAGPDGRVLASVEGRCRGRIGQAPRGSGGFGFDPLFVAGGTGTAPWPSCRRRRRTRLSHRGAAFRALRPVLARLAALDEPGRGTASYLPLSERPVRRSADCFRGVAQPGSAPALGAGGRGSESRRPDSLTARRMDGPLAGGPRQSTRARHILRWV